MAIYFHVSCKQHYYYVYNAITYKNRYTLGINKFGYSTNS